MLFCQLRADLCQFRQQHIIIRLAHRVDINKTNDPIFIDDKYHPLAETFVWPENSVKLANCPMRPEICQ